MVEATAAAIDAPAGWSRHARANRALNSDRLSDIRSSIASLLRGGAGPVPRPGGAARHDRAGWELQVEAKGAWASRPGIGHAGVLLRRCALA